MIDLSIVPVFIAQKQYTKAVKLAEALAVELEDKGYIHFLINILTWQAIAYLALKQETPALASIKRALSLAAPEGYVRSFIKVGPGLIPLLKLCGSAGIMPDYVNTLLSFFMPDTKQRPDQKGTPSTLVEPLSAREMDVLRLLAQGCPDKKIAESLVIARETVHKHLKNIYGKLDVHSRSEAIVRARELNLL